MKNFLDLQATDFYLNIEVNGTMTQVDLKDHLEFNASDRVSVDGIEILPKYQHLAQHSKLIIDQPFYCWLHRVSGQGWLLRPQ